MAADPKATGEIDRVLPLADRPEDDPELDEHYGPCCDQSADDLAIDFACDIAIWLRVHCDAAWTSENEAVQGLAAHLVHMVHNGGSG